MRTRRALPCWTIILVVASLVCGRFTFAAGRAPTLQDIIQEHDFATLNEGGAKIVVSPTDGYACVVDVSSDESADLLRHRLLLIDTATGERRDVNDQHSDGSFRPIWGVRFSSDGAKLFFLAGSRADARQLVEYSIRTGRSRYLTAERREIDAFAVSDSGQIALLSERADESTAESKALGRTGLSISQELNRTGWELYDGKVAAPAQELCLINRSQRTLVSSTKNTAPTALYVNAFRSITLSPNGRFAVVSVYFGGERPERWNYPQLLRNPYDVQYPSAFGLVNTATATIQRLIDAPDLAACPAVCGLQMRRRSSSDRCLRILGSIHRRALIGSSWSVIRD